MLVCRPCQCSSGNLNKTSVREKSRGVYLCWTWEDYAWLWIFVSVPRIESVWLCDFLMVLTGRTQVCGRAVELLLPLSLWRLFLFCGIKNDKSVSGESTCNQCSLKLMDLNNNTRFFLFSYLILPRIQHKVVLLVLRTVFAVGFWLLNLLQLKLWERTPLQIGDSQSAVALYLCVNFHKCVSVSF